MNGRAIGMVVIVVVLISGFCYAGHTDRPLLANEHVKMALHLIEHTGTMGCAAKTGFPAISSETEIEDRIDPGAYPYDVDVFPVVYGHTELTGVAFGMRWPAGWGTTVWTRCVGDQAIGDIVNPGDGTAFTWFACKFPPGDIPYYLVVGWAWLAASAAGEIEISQNPATNRTNVTDCLFAQAYVESVFFAGIGVEPYRGEPKYATEPTTWGKIKAMFR
jgi:hypothetical protein